MTSKRWSSTTKIIVASVLALLAILLLITFRAMIRPTIIALLLTFILYQPVNWVQRRTAWSRGASIISVYIFVVLLLLVTPVLFMPRLVQSFESLVIVLETLVADLQSASTGPLISIGGFELSADSLFQQMGEILQGVLSPAAAGALGFALTLTATVLTSIYVLVLGFWLLKDMNKVQRAVIQALPSDYREDFRRLGQELGAIWSAFLRGQFALALVIGTMTWVVMSILGLPNAAGLSLLAGVMEFMPTVGPGISGTVGTLVALFQGSTWMPVNNLVFAIIVLIAYMIITQIESVYLIPRLVGRRVHLHPAVTFAGIVSAAIVFGVLGVLLATPTIASVRVILTYLLRKLRDVEPFKPSSIQSEVRIPGLIAGHRIKAVVFDLDGTLTRLDWEFADEMAVRLNRLDRFWSLEQRRMLFQRAMAFLEGPIVRWISLLSWLQLHDDLRRMMPLLNRLRGFPPAEKLALQTGTQELLANLSHEYRLGLITTRCAEEVDCFFHTTALPSNLFSSIVTRNETQNLAPQNEAFNRTLEDLNVAADEVLMVCDSTLKLHSAQAAGAVQCGVLSGMGHERAFEDADLVLQDISELDRWL